MTTTEKVEFGDFQTPLGLAREVCALLRQQDIHADTLLEPTCGLGTFLLAGAEFYPKAALLGFDVKSEYVATTKLLLQQHAATDDITIRQQDFFAHDWDAELRMIQGSLMVLGNLPWVTNQAVGSLNGTNVPVKENFQGFRGIEARTGKSNFDISEWMLIRLVRALRGRHATLAMLCKTGTARKLLRYQIKLLLVIFVDIPPKFVYGALCWDRRYARFGKFFDSRSLAEAASMVESLVYRRGT